MELCREEKLASGGEGEWKVKVEGSGGGSVKQTTSKQQTRGEVLAAGSTWAQCFHRVTSFGIVYRVFKHIPKQILEYIPPTVIQ